MAKTPKSAKTDRQAVIDDLRRKQKGAERRRGFAIVGVCALIALVIIGAAAYRPVADYFDQRQFADLELNAIGAPASACGEVTTETAEGSNEHVPTGQQVTYTQSPPAFGPHWAEGVDTDNLAPAPFDRKFYTAADRPELESLVHNTEHGYTVLWYDETAAADEKTLDTIRAIATKFSGSSNLRAKFIAAPWTAADDKEHEGEWPEGQHVAFTHWSAGGEGETDAAKQVGVWQYCSEPSGAALEEFMLDYPYLDSPEPGAG